MGSTTRIEPYEVLLRKFNRSTLESGIMSDVRSKRENSKQVSRAIRRKSAVRQNSLRKVKRGY